MTPGLYGALSLVTRPIPGVYIADCSIFLLSKLSAPRPIHITARSEVSLVAAVRSVAGM